MDAQTSVYLRQNTFSRSPEATIPTLTPRIPTHLLLGETKLPLRHITLSRGLRSNEVAVTYKSTTIFLTPASDIASFKLFINALSRLCISPKNYLLVDQLARGAFGTVFSAVSKDGLQLAIKRVPLTNPLWRTERDILCGLPPHRNIIRVVDTFTSRGHLHIVMPKLVPLTRISKPSLNQSLSIIKSLLSAVAHMHRYGICHNDIKPDNILLPYPDSTQAILTDFGLASHGPGKGGTQAFHAPYGKGPSADVWSVGVVAFLLVTGRMPWDDMRERAEVVRKLKEGVDVISEFVQDPEVTGLLKGLLQVNPRKRLSARAALEHSVFAPSGFAVWSVNRSNIRRVFKSVLFGIRWLESLRSQTVGRTLLM